MQFIFTNKIEITSYFVYSKLFARWAELCYAAGLRIIIASTFSCKGIGHFMMMQKPTVCSYQVYLKLNGRISGIGKNS